jgi:hypothetical protein
LRRIFSALSRHAIAAAVSLIQIKLLRPKTYHKCFMEWNEIVSVPAERDLEVAVIDRDGIHPIASPCRYKEGAWINANTRRRIEINPSHWREWKTGR